MRRAILGVISAIAIFEFIYGACAVEGGHMAFGCLVMAASLAWFGINLVRYGR